MISAIVRYVVACMVVAGALGCRTGETSGTVKESVMSANTVKREGGKVWIEKVTDARFGIQWDMLVRAMQTLLEFRGQKATLNELLAYSGDAFNLCHASNWQGVAYLCIPTDPTANIARAYGFDYACTSDGYTGPMLNNKTREERLALAHKALARIYAEIDAGRPVLLAGAEEHCGSVTLVVGYDREKLTLSHVGDGKPCRWTAIRGVAPGAVDEKFGLIDGRLRGTVRKGFAGGWQANPACLIGEQHEKPTHRESILAALQRAVELHRAPRHHIGWWGGVDYHFGAEAYEQWAKDLRDLDYPADLKKGLPKDAYDWYEMGNMDTQVDQVIRGRTAAAEFCESAADVLPSGKDRLLVAAKLYREEVAIARKTFAVFQLPWDGNDAPRTAWLSDETKRGAGVVAIGQMLQKEQAAVSEIEGALMKDRVKREDGKVWIEGVGVAPGGMCTCIHAITTVMQGIGEKEMTYPYLMGVSGMAFRMQMSADGWCPSSPNAYCGYRCAHFAVQALPREMKGHSLFDKDPEKIKRARAALVASIDAGRPVQFGSEEDSVCVGYADGGKIILALALKDKDGSTKTHEVKDLPWGIGVVGELRTPPPRRELVLTSLQRAIEMWRIEKSPDEKHGYWMGAKAWERWIADLEDDVKFERMSDEKEESPDAFFSNALGNAWTYESLFCARKAAAAYLPFIADDFKPDTAAHLKKAGELYGQVYETLNAANPNVRYPWRMKTKANWTKEMRTAQAEAMKKAFRLDKQAVAEIEAALKSEGVSMSAEGRTQNELKELRMKPTWITHMGCLIACAEYLKVDASPAWIYGGSGYAFALNVHEVICPSGPTAWPAEKCEALAANVGIRTERFQGPKSREDVSAFRESIWKKTSAAIDAGTPCFGWEMDIPEWYVVHGYDADGNYLYRDFGDKVGKRHYTKLGETGIGWIVMVHATKGEKAPDRTVVREALRFAVEHGGGAHSNELYHTGLSGYDAWIKALEDEKKVAADEGIGFGCAYNAQCWGECRKHAVAFLEEAKKRLDDDKLDPLFDEAITRYRVVADRLGEVAGVFAFDVRDQDAMKARIREADRRARAVKALKAARDAEKEGLASLRKIADALAE